MAVVNASIVVVNVVVMVRVNVFLVLGAVLTVAILDVSGTMGFVTTPVVENAVVVIGCAFGSVMVALSVVVDVPDAIVMMLKVTFIVRVALAVLAVAVVVEDVVIKVFVVANIILVVVMFAVSVTVDFIVVAVVLDVLVVVNNTVVLVTVNV